MLFNKYADDFDRNIKKWDQYYNWNDSFVCYYFSHQELNPM